ncbi:DUF7547 family protein [Halovenus salina]|uniref:DUF7547 family protein n=1 Tax=Halovenus salina TaxID=1510225 RepID=UPI002260E642|nr:hypothetical protein [Halovenus salina]
MSDADSDPEIRELLSELTTTLQELEDEVERGRPRGPRLPTANELARFTSEVAIPGLVLLLRTNIRALQLLQRTLRLADGREPSPEGTVSEARNRAEDVGRASLSQLDDVLTDLQSALEGRSESEQATELLDRARDLREEVQDELAQDGATPAESPSTDDAAAIGIDIESELESLKDDLDEADDNQNNSGTDDAPDDGDDEPS